MESELNFVYAISKSEIGHVGTFYHTHELFLLIFLVFLMVGSDRYEWSQFSLVTEAIKREANINFIIERDNIKDFFEI